MQLILSLPLSFILLDMSILKRDAKNLAKDGITIHLTGKIAKIVKDFFKVKFE
jgi:hypothetical protein